MMNYTDEMRKFIRDNYKGISNKELAKRFNKQFNTSVSVSMMKKYKSNHHLNSGLTGRFEKGHIPHNKGKKCEDDTYQRAPIGSEYATSDGYIKIKTGRNEWKYKQAVVWEKHHGKVPENSTIIFLDGNRKNVSIENLRCISKGESAYLNLFGMREKELIETGILMGRLTMAINKKQRRKTD